MMMRPVSRQLLRPTAASGFRGFRATLAPLVKAGDSIPSIIMDQGFGPDQQKVDLAELCKGSKIILLGLPGAFTPC